MLDDNSYLVTRSLLSAREQETKWTYMAYRVGVEVSNGKRWFELNLEEEEGLRKALNVCDHKERLSRAQFDSLSLTLATPMVVHSDSHRQASDKADKDFLIHPIGRDITINCLLHCSRADNGSIASLNQSFLSLINSGEMYRLRRQNKVIEHWVYFSCRLLEWVTFDPATQRWIQLPRMNCNECFTCYDKESLAVGIELLLFGKDLMSHVIYKYSILTNSWSSDMSMNSPRCLFESTSLGEIAILAGGCDTRGNILSSAELYVSKKKTWVTLPSINKPRKMCLCFFTDDKFYVIGGIGGNDARVLTCAEEFNLKMRTLKEIPDLTPGNHGAVTGNDIPAPAAAPPLIVVVNNELYAVDHADMEVKKYNKETRGWVTVGRLPERVSSMNRWGLAFKACGDRAIVIGGLRGHGEGIIEINSWVPGEGPSKWVLLGRKRSRSFVYNCIVMRC